MRVDGDGWLVSIRGEHDLSTAPMLTEQFDKLFETGPFVIADLNETTFLDSQVIRVFMSAVRRSADDPRQRFALVVDIENARARRLLDLTQPITGDIPTFASREEALKALGGRPGNEGD